MKVSKLSITRTISGFILLFMTLMTAQSMEITPHTEAMTLNNVQNLNIKKIQSYQNTPFVTEQLKMLEGKELRLWGIGIFAGDDLVSAVIRKLSHSSWSHVALIIADQTDYLYCFESTASYDEIMHKGILPQVRISPWINACDEYSGAIASRQFVFREDHQPNTKTVGELVHNMIGKPYERDLFSLIEVINRASKKRDISSLFCSELVAEVMQELGYLKKDKLSDNYLPKDFSTEMTLDLINTAFRTEIIFKGKKFDEGEMFDSHPCASCMLF